MKDFSGDDIWLKELSQGKEDAFSQLFERYYTPLVIFAVSYLEDEEMARDIVQDVFLSLYNNKEIFSTISKLKAYLYTFVKNNCLNYIRKEKVKDKYISYTLYIDKDEDLFWDKVLEEEVYYYLYKAIDKLPPKARQVYLLTMDGLKNKEIAEQLNISIETVRSHKKNNKRLLKKYLEGLVSIIYFIGL